MQISRRQFAQLAAAAPLLAQQTPLTAQQVVERIQKSLGAWLPNTLDGFKAGDPATAITGIATTAMATLDVLGRAVKEKANLIITAEPVFYSRTEGPPLTGADDPVYAAKKDFIQKNGLVVWRFADNWRARKPDPFAVGLGRTLGWTKYQKDGPSQYDLPAATLASLADALAKGLNARAGIRVVGDPQSVVRRVALLPGLSALPATVGLLPDCDVVIAGEVREWESVEYAHDTVAAGQKKGLIMLGRLLSLEPGMSECATWLKTVVPEVSVRSLPAGDPYWRRA